MGLLDCGDNTLETFYDMEEEAVDDDQLFLDCSDDEEWERVESWEDKERRVTAPTRPELKTKMKQRREGKTIENAAAGLRDEWERDVPDVPFGS